MKKEKRIKEFVTDEEKEFLKNFIFDSLKKVKGRAIIMFTIQVHGGAGYALGLNALKLRFDGLEFDKIYTKEELKINEVKMRSYLQKHNKIKYSIRWSSSKEIIDLYIILLNYFDPCPLFSNGFDFKFIDKELFINPPYSNISLWVDYAINNHKQFNKHTVILIPSRTDTKYFHKLLEYGCDLEFIRGRLKFGDQKGYAPVPSVLVHLNKKI